MPITGVFTYLHIALEDNYLLVEGSLFGLESFIILYAMSREPREL